MTQPIFVSVDAHCRVEWREAFSDLIVCSLDTIPRGAGVLWVLQPNGQGAENLARQLSRSIHGRAWVLMADEPNEDEAIAVLAAGASGYCNGHAAPEVLRQVASVISHGGVWVGQGLLKRLLASTTPLLSAVEPASSSWQDNLTQRERETALLLAKGASNKEIARDLDITERTVKAHVSAILEKLGVRDRLQLSLVINGVDQVRR